MKIIIVGINHAGTSALRTLLALSKEHEITAYDRNSNISFLGCGIALAVGGIVKNLPDLFYCTPEKLEKSGAKVFMNHEVIAINYLQHTITVKNLETGKEFEDNYDKLIYAAGSWPVDIPGIPEEKKNLENVEICKLFQHAQELIRKADDHSIQSVAVVGSGYIGIELAEAYHTKGKQVTLIDLEKRILPRYFDAEFTNSLEEDIRNSGVTLALGEKVLDFEARNGKVCGVVTDKQKYSADLVIKAVGFKPNTALLPEAKKTANGAVIVDKYMRSSLADIYAIGDAAAIYHASLDQHVNVALATNAVKSGIAAACNICGEDKVKLESIAGTNAICVFGNKLASTGISEDFARQLGLNVASSFIEDDDRPLFMGTTTKTKVKIVFDKSSLRLLGAQIGTKGEISHTETIYYLALAIQQKLSIIDLAFADVYFLPHFNKPFNFVLTAIMQAFGLEYQKE